MILDFVSLVVLCYYQSVLKLDNYVTIVLLLSLNINAIMFIFAFLCFVLTIEIESISKDFLEQYIDIEEKNLL